MNPPPPRPFRAIISQNFFSAHRAFATFFFRVLRNFYAIFVKIGRTLQVTQRYVIERRLKIWKFSGFVYKTWEMAFCAKNPFWALKVLFAFILVNITVICIDYQYLKHKDSFGKSENLSKIFFAQIIVFDHDYEGKSSSSNGLLWISFFYFFFIYLNYFSNCSEGLRTNLYTSSTILCKV